MKASEGRHEKLARAAALLKGKTFASVLVDGDVKGGNARVGAPRKEKRSKAYTHVWAIDG